MVVALVRALVDLGAEAAGLPQAEAVERAHAVVAGLDGLEPGDDALLGYALRLTLSPRSMRAAHLAPLRAAGLSDDEVHDVAQVVACFNTMNRLADGLGVAQSPANEAWARRLLGEAAWTAHLAWARP